MKKHPKGNFYKKCILFGKKNLFCRVLIFPVVALTAFLESAFSYCTHNGKRFSMLAMTLLLFAVYSSFSFPMFIGSTENDSNGLDLNVTGSQDVALAEEADINMEDVEILDDEDVLEGFEQEETSHGLDIIDKYDVTEILESTPERLTHPSEDDEEENVTFSAEDWRLVLINKQHPIPEDYSFTLGTITGSMQCDERIIDDLLNMLQAAKEDNVDLMICSPYRDMERQVMLFERKIKRYIDRGMSYMEAYQLSSQAVTVPGASEHQIGLALDIVCGSYTALDEGFGDTEAGKWLAENSCDYGFILRYPKDKEYITGIEYEPWHFRYVGVEAATVIMRDGITLEEFLEDL